MLQERGSAEPHRSIAAEDSLQVRGSHRGHQTTHPQAAPETHTERQTDRQGSISQQWHHQNMRAHIPWQVSARMGKGKIPGVKATFIPGQVVCYIFFVKNGSILVNITCHSIPQHEDR